MTEELNETWDAFWGETCDFENPKEAPTHQYLSDRRRIIADAVEKLSVKPKPVIEKKSSSPRDKSGFVYLVKSDRGFYKIGHSKSLDKRMRIFNVKLPFEVELEHVIECKDRFKAEKYLHGKFASKRGNGEWFSLTVFNVKWIKGIKTDDQFDYPR